MAAPSDQADCENTDENILYDLLINTEWPPEPDVQVRGSRGVGCRCTIGGFMRTDLPMSCTGEWHGTRSNTQRWAQLSNLHYNHRDPMHQTGKCCLPGFGSF